MMATFIRLGLLLAGGAAVACSSDGLRNDGAGTAGSAGLAGAGSAGGGAPGASGAGYLTAATALEIYQPGLKLPLSATDLAFSGVTPGELWVTLRQFPSGKRCTEADDSGCAALPGVVAILSEATSVAPQGTLKEDGNSWHFMRRPTTIAWGKDNLFGTCGEARTDNFDDSAEDFAGPVLWSSDPQIFGVEPKATQNGTHLDMLHETPYCMGIAHESANAYWVVNGDVGALDRYDFHAPHKIGGDDHANGEVYRYVKGTLLRTAEVPSHLEYDAESGFVYVADTGHGRVLRVDPRTATLAGPIPTLEELHASGEMRGAELVELVPPGLLERPSGLALAGRQLLVTDNATSRIHLFSLDGAEIRAFDTGLPAGSLSGVTVGPDDKVYFTNLLTGAVFRLEPLKGAEP